MCGNISCSCLFHVKVAEVKAVTRSGNPQVPLWTGFWGWLPARWGLDFYKTSHPDHFGHFFTVWDKFLSDGIQIECQNTCEIRCQIECQNLSQINCQSICHGGDHSKKVYNSMWFNPVLHFQSLGLKTHRHGFNTVNALRGARRLRMSPCMKRKGVLV